jgi:hypothetical protein
MCCWGSGEEHRSLGVGLHAVLLAHGGGVQGGLSKPSIIGRGSGMLASGVEWSGIVRVLWLRW